METRILKRKIPDWLMLGIAIVVSVLLAAGISVWHNKDLPPGEITAGVDDTITFDGQDRPRLVMSWNPSTSIVFFGDGSGRFSTGQPAVLEIHSSGEIYHLGRLISTDADLAAGLWDVIDWNVPVFD